MAVASIDVDISAALDELQAAVGPNNAAEVITILGLNYPAFVSDVPSDQQLLAGGETEVAKFTALVNKRDLATRPQPGSACVVRGVSLSVLTLVTDKRVFWEIPVGDYSNE